MPTENNPVNRTVCGRCGQVYTMTGDYRHNVSRLCHTCWRDAPYVQVASSTEKGEQDEVYSYSNVNNNNEDMEYVGEKITVKMHSRSSSVAIGGHDGVHEQHAFINMSGREMCKMANAILAKYTTKKTRDD